MKNTHLKNIVIEERNIVTKYLTMNVSQLNEAIAFMIQKHKEPYISTEGRDEETQEIVWKVPVLRNELEEETSWQ